MLIFSYYSSARQTMGQTQSSYNINTLIDVFKKTAQGSQTEIMQALSKARETTTNIIPDNVSDVLVLLMAAILIALVVLMYTLNKSLKHQEKSRAHQIKILQDDITKRTLKTLHQSRTNPFHKPEVDDTGV